MINETTAAAPVPSAEAQEGGQPYLETIARLEAAAKGERDLDASIFRLIGLTDRQERHCRDWCRMDGRTDLTRERYIQARAPSYTTSIDDALTLVPPWSWRVGNLPSGRGFADLGTQNSLQCVEGATPALALCIACLRAKASPATVAADNGTPPKTDETKGTPKRRHPMTATSQCLNAQPRSREAAALERAELALIRAASALAWCVGWINAACEDAAAYPEKELQAAQKAVADMAELLRDGDTQC